MVLVNDASFDQVGFGAASLFVKENLSSHFKFNRAQASLASILNRGESTNVNRDFKGVVESLAQIEFVFHCVLVVEEAIFKFLVQYCHLGVFFFLAKRRVHVLNLHNLSVDLFGVSFSNAFSHVEVIVWCNNCLALLLVKELSEAFRIPLHEGCTSSTLLAEMLFDQLLSEGQLVEKPVTDLVVVCITLQTVFDVLQVADGGHLTGHALINQLSVPSQFVLDHGLHW